MSDMTYTSAIAVTPSDSAVLPITAALYVGGTGDLAVKMGTGVFVVFKGVPVGVFPLAVTKVMASGSGTTATDIIALR